MLNKIYTILFFIVTIFSQTGHAQIEIRLYQPPPNQLNVEHLWNFDLLNNSTQTFEIYLSGIATDIDGSLIFEARSSEFRLQPGFKRVSVPEISPIHVSFSNSDYEQIVLKTGSVPAGQYEVCIAVISAMSGEPLGRDCLQQTVEHIRQPQLVSPFDEANISEAFPVFTWMHPDIPESGFRLKIVEILDGQNPLEAIQANPAWLELADIQTTTIQYPLSAREMTPGQQYAWQVIAAMHDIDAANSEVYSFTFVAVKDDDPGISPTAKLIDGRIFGRSFLLQEEIYNDLRNAAPEIDPETVLMPGDSLQEFAAINWIEDGAMQQEMADIKMAVSSAGASDEIVAMNFHYRSAVDSLWNSIGYDETGEDGWTMHWDTKAVASGFYEIRAQAVNRDNSVAVDYTAVQIGDLPQYTPVVVNGNQVLFNVTVSESDINNKWNEAQRERDQAAAARDRQRRLTEQRNQKIRDYCKAAKLKVQLQRLDSVLDEMPNAFQGRINALLDSLKAIRNNMGGVPNQQALQRAVNNAQARLDACRNRLANLKQQQQNLQQRRDDLKQQQDDLLNQFDKLHHDDGWIGESGFHDDGQVWWGYIGDENSTIKWGTPNYNQARQLQRQIQQLNRQYLNTLARLNQLAASIAAAETDCQELEDQLKQVQQAKKQGNAYQAAQIDIAEICREIRSLLQPLLEWCDDNPDYCNFGNQLRQLMADCPEDEASWRQFWQSFENIKNRKKATEDELEREAKRLSDEIKRMGKQISEAGQQAREHGQNARTAESEAERLRAKRKRQISNQKAKQSAEDRRQQRLLKRAENGDQDAIRQLMTEFGLSAIGETSQAAGNLIVILKGLLVLKDMPDCACKIMRTLKDLLNPNNATFVLSSAYLDQWRQCTSLPAISSVVPGTKQVADIVRQIPVDTRRKAISAIERILAVKCR